MKLGVISCEIMRQEMERVLADDPAVEIVHSEFVEFGRHAEPDRLRQLLVEKVAALEGQVDAVLLGYGRCQALGGIEAQAALPVVLPPADDCIGVLLGQGEYEAQLAKCAGTWFMTPGWCKQGIDALTRELRLSPGFLLKMAQLKKTPLEIWKRMLRDYKRVLLIETGVGDPAEHEQQAQDFADVFGLAVEAVPGSLGLLRESLAKAVALARR